MAAELIDLRLKITPETACVLAADARASDADKAEIARQILHEHALRRIEAASLLVNCLRAKGLNGAAEGITSADGRSSGQGGATLDWEDAK